ncbi:MAG: hypothetical protein ACRDWT_00135, partial [Jatrophihabitantaceae bacterium]
MHRSCGSPCLWPVTCHPARPAGAPANAPANAPGSARRQRAPHRLCERVPGGRSPVTEQDTRPKLAVIGTGYLGVTHAVCMVELGFDVIGLDVDPAKLALLRAGRLP